VSGAAAQSDSSSVFGALRREGSEGQPEVVFRCEEGRLSAYLVTTATGGDSLAGEHEVPISLDSAPSCSQ
jgi:hypothetical protein